MNIASGEQIRTEQELEADAAAFHQAQKFVGALAVAEAAQSNDNHGGVLLHRSIPFGD